MRRLVLFLACVMSLLPVTCGVASAATCQIDGGAKWTNDPTVVVSYDPGTNTEFRMNLSGTFDPSSKWQAVTPRHRILCYVGGHGNGRERISMQFRKGPDASTYDLCEASILVDTVGPRGAAASATVKSGRLCKISFKLTDGVVGSVDRAPVCATITISTRWGRVVMADTPGTWVKSAVWCSWRFRCRLRPAKYLIAVWGVDEAGNQAESIGYAFLRVDVGPLSSRYRRRRRQQSGRRRLR